MKRLITRLVYGRFTAATFRMIDTKGLYTFEERDAFRAQLKEIADLATCDIPPIRMLVP